MNRREFCQQSVVFSTGLTLPAGPFLSKAMRDKPPAITDTFVNLFEWPFRTLKYADTEALAEKLKQHRITRAWAGSFEALYHKDMSLVNERLYEECKRHGKGMLLPVGSVNTSWPGWEEDLRRCAEVHGMKGIRIFPIYQMMDLNSPDFQRLLELTLHYRLFLQIVGDLEDPRHHHPLTRVHETSFEPLPEIAGRFPGARIQLLHWNRQVGASLLARLVRETTVTFDISRIEGAGELGGLIAGSSWYGPEIPVAATRFLFGSHAPYFPVESALLKLFESPLTKMQLKLIMAENAAKLTG